MIKNSKENNKSNIIQNLKTANYVTIIKEPNIHIEQKIVLNLQFFEGEKTEKPTYQKRKKARGEGQVAKSQELSTAFLFLGIFSAFKMLSGFMYTKLFTLFQYCISLVSNMDTILEGKEYGKIMAKIAFETVIIVAPIFLVAMAIGLVTNLIQVGWHPTAKPLKPKFSKINPIAGFKRLFSLKAIVELIKSLAKFGVIIFAVQGVLMSHLDEIFGMYEQNLVEIVSFFGGIAIEMGLSVGRIYLLIAIFDIVYTRWKHTKDLKMSKQEIKDEYKQSEGNPEVKGKIKQKMREASMRRMMGDVPTADVIITNPTHYAVALKYDASSGRAPIVVAKGVDLVAKRIREVGAENNVEIVENRPLARALYADVDISSEIPVEMYKAVAEVLAYVHKLRNK